MSSLPPAPDAPFYPRQHVERHLTMTWTDDSGKSRHLSAGAKLLAMYLANHVRVMTDGKAQGWIAWPALTTLSKVLGMSVKTVSTARQQLERAGLVKIKKNVPTIEADGKVYHTRGLHVMELVRDVQTFVQARDAARARERAATDAATHEDRVRGPQRRLLAGEIDAAERERQERQMKTEHRRSKRGELVKITSKDRAATRTA